MSDPHNTVQMNTYLSGEDELFVVLYQLLVLVSGYVTMLEEVCYE